MTQPEQQQGSAAVVVERSEGAPPFPRLVMGAAGVLLGVAADWLIGLDALWPMITAGVASGVLALAADVAVARLMGSGRVRRARVAQVIGLVIAAVLVAGLYRVDRTSAFETVFGTSPPWGLTHVDTERLPARDTGRRLTVVQFEASKEQVDALVAARAFKARDDFVIKPGREAKAQRSVWGSAFSRYGLTLLDRWKNRLPVTEPKMWHWTGTDRGTMGEQSSLLWDAKTGLGYAVHASAGVTGENP